MSSSYIPPRVWTWDSTNGGEFASINRPVSGAPHEKNLPVGEHPLQLYSLGTPNGAKVTIMLEELLAGRTYIAGEEYSIADMAIWPWYGDLVRGGLYNAEVPEFLSVSDYPNLKRWADRVFERPAVQRGRRVNRVWGDASLQLAERHHARDLDQH
ncbi:glutathione S-transferase [Oceanisphaera litoralis]|uniref:glutathione binding-like protein n=1 Tax=Oceanisphaera litoralis TaxID=225144 RepID=UPI001959D0AA|nr:glutathione binding-like protein [Oceanisphaera litoralis]MBM7455877.1 glutathione S-transferase [Oceanisphaera litoralis]